MSKREVVGRRRFVTRAAAVLGAGALAGCRDDSGVVASAPSVHTQERIRWQMASSFPRGLDTLYGGAETLAQGVAAMTGGRFEIQSYPAGEIVPALQVLDAVQQGTVEVGQTASYYYTGKNPALAFDCCVPFGLTARQQSAWLLEGGGRELLQDLFADFSVVSFPAGNTGVQMGGWFKRELESLASLRDLKIRIPGLGGEVMSRLGATVQVLAGGDIFPALERGAIDATEWVGPYDDEKLGFHRVAKYYYYPGWWEPGPSLSFYVNKPMWDGLSADYREVFAAAAAQAATVMQARYDARNPPALARLIAGGTAMRPFPVDLLAAAEARSFELFEEQATADPAYRAVYDGWKKFRTGSYRWFAAAELSYAGFAYPRG